MKTIEDISHARHTLVASLLKPISIEQKVLLQGMLCALCWVAENPNGATLDRLVKGEPIAIKE